MKFGKSLSNQIVEMLPEWRDKFLSYKELKKHLKRIGGERLLKKPRLGDEDETSFSTEEEEEDDDDFLRLLQAELDKFNAFFVEKEEEYIIRLKELQDTVGSVAGKDAEDELMMVRKEIVDFHGEMVLLENYSALNYTGLVKILKKYDKRTGALIRLPFIHKVLQQPFFTTDLLYKLVKECELMLDQLFPKNEESVSGDHGSKEGPTGVKQLEKGSSSLGRGEVPELDDIERMESLYMKSTVAALRVLKEIRSGSSTVSVFSLPPMQSSGIEERNRILVLEQAAE